MRLCNFSEFISISTASVNIHWRIKTITITRRESWTWCCEKRMDLPERKSNRENERSSNGRTSTIISSSGSAARAASQFTLHTPIPSIDLTMSSKPESHSSALSARWLFPVCFSLLVFYFLFFFLFFSSASPWAKVATRTRACARCIASSRGERSDCCRVSR